MKKKYFLFILIAISFIGCQDVVDVDLNSAPPKLVIDASIDWQKGTTGNIQMIKLSTTTDYYSNQIPIVSGATVYITNSENVIFNFIENGNSGKYICMDFAPVINEVYTLTILYNGQSYSAKETLKSVAPIIDVVPNNDGGFTGKTIEIKTYFKDPDVEENYYLFKYKYSNQVKLNYNVEEDKFFQGNTFFSISRNNDLKVGDVIEVSHFGISKSYYNYMSVLLSIAGNSGGSPFQSPPATVRGNIVNTTNPENYALGYFRLSEVDSRKHIIE